MKRATVEDAERLALSALQFLAEDKDRLYAFFNASGLDPAALRDQAHTKALLTGLLDYLASDESLWLTFCAETRTDPKLIGSARAALQSGSGR